MMMNTGSKLETLPIAGSVAPRSARVRVSVSSSPSPDWDVFVAARPAASVYLESCWSLLAREAFGHQTFFLEALSEDHRLIGILPLVRQKSWICGDFLTSLPFFNYGGALADEDAVAIELMERARELGKELGCKYVEIRDTRPYGGSWEVRKDKVSMVLDLPGTFDTLASSLGSKLRSQVRRSDRENPEIVRGGRELLEDFYYVFAHNMRDLGTPVYPRRFFELILQHAPDSCRLVTVRRNGRPAAAGFLITHCGVTEIPWAACLGNAKPLGFNMRLYWEVLREAIEQGSSRFDFGRSTTDSGTFRFKKQWGAKPVQLYWHRWERDEAREDHHRSTSCVEALLIEAWRRMPVWLANALGPMVSPNLPW